MMMLFAYLILAVLIIAFAVLLTRHGTTGHQPLRDREKERATIFLNDSGLDLAQRIFDPDDYRWLKDEIGFPELARELFKQRKAMALMWLRCLRASFNELVRMQSSGGMLGGDEIDSSAWAMTFHTLRFQFLLTYAMAVVWTFGPYTRIAPSFVWLRPLFSRRTHKEEHGLHA